MDNVAKMARIKAILHNSKLSHEPYNARPASEMVGQNCIGYYPTSGGKLIRIAQEVTGPEFVGPGSYDPKLLTHSRSSTIPRSDRNMALSQTHYRAGPGDYMVVPPQTHLTHKLRLSDPPKPRSPPKSGELGHTSWTDTKKQIKPLFHSVQRTTPAFRESQTFIDNHKENHETKSYDSYLYDNDYDDSDDFQGRPIWKPPPRGPDPTSHALQPQLLSYESCDKTFQFLSKISRFQEPKSEGPTSTTYTIPSLFGSGPSTIIHPAYVPLGRKRNSTETNENSLSLNDSDIKEREFNFQKKDSINGITIPHSQRFEEKITNDPGPATYSIQNHAKPKQTLLLTSTTTKNNNWDYLPALETPDAGSYQKPIINPPKKGGYISKIGHNAYQSMPDHPLAFRTQHSSLIKKSYNSHYFPSLPKIEKKQKPKINQDLSIEVKSTNPISEVINE